MIETIVDFVNQNQSLLNTAAAFITGACLLYLVLARTLRKRRSEEAQKAV
ncbi:hypothetical protein [Aliiruegeria lutimaris]|uniref:Uncharacterized protein n=1 Tax=Aliiruegeria lutimaris TaxID=571298 RepID=A0A1G8XWL6_9RHOB|nr:hypothetical protein [Aliiruegeria lutimaris]SDJ94891.1 hypothetical protein SAMN04488026_102753 [Aliiruegeria lutimaris]